MTTDDNVARIADRRRQWQHLPAEQRRQRIQAAVLDTVEIARWRRMRRQNRTNDGMFPERTTIMTTYNRSDRRHWRCHLRRVVWRINYLLILCLVLAGAAGADRSGRARRPGGGHQTAPGAARQRQPDDLRPGRRGSCGSARLPSAGARRRRCSRE